MRREFLLLLAGASATALGAAGARAQEAEPTITEREIVVYGARVDPLALLVEDEINEADIAAYAADTVADLLAQLGEDLGADEDGPVVLVNGELATGVDEIADLPAEAVNRVQLLSGDAAAKLGQRPGQRVVNVVLKRAHQQYTVSAEQAFATAGKGTSRNASMGWTKITGPNRNSFTARIRQTDPLLESDRGVLSRSAGTPFDLIGNVVPFPLSAGEIDPALSALAGGVVTVAAVPAGVDGPTLQQLAAGAEAANPGDVGRFRSLIADQLSVSLNGTIARRLAPRTNLTINLRGDLSDNDRIGSAPSVLLQLPASSPFSPFGRDVGIARFLPVPLRQRRDSGSVEAGAVLNHRLETWNLSAKANYTHRESESRNERGTDLGGLQAAVLAGALNPFAPVPLEYLEVVRADVSSSSADRATAQLVANGPLAQLPAGPLTASFRLGAEFDRFETLSTFSGPSVAATLTREELNGQANIDVPLSRRQPETPTTLGDLSLNLTAGFSEISQVGTLINYGVGFSWRPVPEITVRGALNEDQLAPAVASLSDPVEVTPGVRFFDFIRDETVDVTVISGGNLALPSQDRQVLTLAVNFKPTLTSRTNFNAEYRRTRSNNTVSGLPPLSAIVQAAFAERFLRDADGRLFQVDSRPVSFARDEQEQLRWGANLTGSFGPIVQRGGRRLGGAAPSVASADDGDDEAPPMPSGPTNRTWRYNLSVNHVWALNNTRLIRVGIPLIDLLGGGAVGFLGGQPRHIVQFNAGVSGKGVGLQANGNWRSATEFRLGQVAAPGDLRFSPRATINLRANAELGTLLPNQAWAKGLRLTAGVNNLFDSEQIVRDRIGGTPLRYQRYLLDPLGRAITFGVRKVF